MTKSTRDVRRVPRARSPKSPQSRIPQAFQIIEAEATVRARASAAPVPKLVLSGEWLRAVGFPVGSAAVLTTDRLGEMTLHRLGLSLPRRIRIKACCD